MEIPEGAWRFRPYCDEGQAAFDELIDADADPLWATQGHQLHGESRDGERWRRTVVAESAGRVAGAVTVARNRVHPGRYNLAVEVGAASRRRGLGRALIDQARRLAPEPLPHAAKLRPSDPAAIALLHRVGGRVYQRCPGLCPDPAAPQIRAWAAAATPDADAVVLPLSEHPRPGWADLWVQQYLWVHHDWSPAAEGPLRELTHGLIAEVDPELSTVTMRSGRVEAVTWVFDANDGTVEVVAETIQPQTSDGVADVAAGLARSLSKLNERGTRKAAIDGHLSDPHLALVLEGFPVVPREPLHLVEIDPEASN